jgi:hypothetical protein
VPNLLYVGAGDITCDPTDVILRCRDFPIERESRLYSNERLAGFHEVDERLIQLLRSLRTFVIDHHLDSCVSELPETGSAYKRIGILHGGYNSYDARSDDRIGTRLGAPEMRARFERYVKRRASGSPSRLPQRHNLSVILRFPFMKTTANNLPILFDHSSHGWIRAGESFAFGCETDGLLHE